MTSNQVGAKTAKPAVRRAPLEGSPEPIAALNRVRIDELKHPWETHEPLVDIRQYCTGVSLHKRICPYLRRTAADMLNAAQEALPAGYQLKVGTALRTLHMQKSGWDGYMSRMRNEHPEWPLSALRRSVNRYFAPYDQKAPPGHCTGGAVDVGLLDPAGEPVDLVAPTKGWEAAYTWSDLIHPETKQMRMMMVRAMLDAGFSNCRDEYWHYSYGDSAWAVRVGEQHCPYGWAHPPVTVETEFEGGMAGKSEVEIERDGRGKVLRADIRATAVVSPSGTQPVWDAEICWANGVPVTVTLETRGGLPTRIYALGSEETWEEIVTSVSGDCSSFFLVPARDRQRLSTAPPPAPPAKAPD